MQYNLREVQEVAMHGGIEYDRTRKILETYGHEVIQEIVIPEIELTWNGTCGGEVNVGACVVCRTDVEACWIKPVAKHVEHCTLVQCIVTATLQGGGYDPALESLADRPIYCVPHIPRA